MKSHYRTFHGWDREFIENRYRELCGDGIAKTDISALKICGEMDNKYAVESIINAITVLRRTLPVPACYLADVESGVLQRAKDGERCGHCSMPLYYRMQKNGKYIHSWLCPWCHSDECVMDWRAKTNRRPVGEQDYRNLQDKNVRLVR